MTWPDDANWDVTFTLHRIDPRDGERYWRPHFERREWPEIEPEPRQPEALEPVPVELDPWVLRIVEALAYAIVAGLVFLVGYFWRVLTP